MDQATNQNSKTPASSSEITEGMTPSSEIQHEIFQPPDDYKMLLDNVLDQNKKSAVIEIVDPSKRVARMMANQKYDGDVKTILGTEAMEKFSQKAEAKNSLDSEDPSKSKFYVAFRIDSLASNCLCVGIQQEGADLEKDSFEFKQSFLLNCKNGDVMRVGQQKQYAKPDVVSVQNGSIVGMMLNMHDGEISFAIDDKFCGVASKDKRLKQGKFFTSILLMNPEDQVTLLNPELIKQASHGFNLMFEKLKIHQEHSPAFQNLFGRIQNHFSYQNPERDLQRLIIMGYLNDRVKFEKLAALLKEVWKKEQGYDKSNQMSESSKSSQLLGKNIPKSLSQIHSEYIMKMVLESHLNPQMISYFEYKDDFLKNAFDKCVNQQITSLLQFYFMVVEIKTKLEGGAGEGASVASEAGNNDESNSQQIEESKPEEGAEAEKGEQKNSGEDQPADAQPEGEGEPPKDKDDSETHQAQYDFLCMQIYNLLGTFPQPKLTQQMEQMASQSPENMFKFKLMDINEKLLKMSALEFDRICLGRIERQSEEVGLQVSKTLFASVKRAIALIAQQEAEDESSSLDKNEVNEKMMKKFNDFAGQLE